MYILDIEEKQKKSDNSDTELDRKFEELYDGIEDIKYKQEDCESDIDNVQNDIQDLQLDVSSMERSIWKTCFFQSWYVTKSIC